MKIKFIVGVTLLSFYFLKDTYCQKINGEIFIPMNNRNEIWLRPKVDTLENGKDYSFKIRVAPQLNISQFLFEKGLAVQNDSMLVIKANSTRYGEIDTATLRVIVNSIGGGRIMLFQKQFLVRVPEKVYPLISNPKRNLIKINDKVLLERDKPYPKEIFTQTQPFVTMYDNETSETSLKVTGVTIAMMEKEGKHYISTGDTISMDAMHELKKIRNPIPIFIKVDALKGKSRRSVWNKIIVYAE